MINYFGCLLCFSLCCFSNVPLSGQKEIAQTEMELDSIETISKPVKRGDIAFFLSTGKADFYRSDDQKFSPIGSSSVSAWMSGISLRSGKKWYEVKVDLYYALQGGRELFQSLTDGTVESEVSLSYLGLRAQPINIRWQKEKFYLHVGGGGYATVLLNESVKVNDRLFEGKGSEYQLTEYDYGLAFSGGAGYGRINIVGTFQVGLQPIETYTNIAKNHLLTIGLNIWL